MRIPQDFLPLAEEVVLEKSASLMSLPVMGHGNYSHLSLTYLKFTQISQAHNNSTRIVVYLKKNVKLDNFHFYREDTSVGVASAKVYI